MKFETSSRILLVFTLFLVGCAEKSVTVSEKTKPEQTAGAVLSKKTEAEKNNNNAPEKKSHKPKVEKPPIEQRIYGGENIAFWKAKFKLLDCTSQEAIQSIDGLIEIVRDDDLPWFTRKQAGRLLGKIGKPAEKAIPVFVALIQDEEVDGSSVLLSLHSLSEFAVIAKSATSEIANIALDRNRKIPQRLAAMNALARIGSAHPDAISSLEQLAAARIRRDANTVHEMWQLRKSAAEAFRVIGPDGSSAVPVLVKAIRSAGKKEAVRIHAIRALGAMGARAEPAIPVIAGAMVFDEIGAVCEAASQALGAIGPAAIPDLLRLLDNATSQTKARIAKSLGLMGASAKETVEKLDLLLDDDDGNVRLTAAIAIWEIDRNERRTVPAIVQELTNADRHVRRKAYEQLLQLEFSPAVLERALTKLENDDRGYVRSIARKALRTIRSQE